MKKKIAFLMASIMTVSTVTMSKVNSFASSDNRLSNGNITVSEKTLFYERGANVTINDLKDQSNVKYLAEANYLSIGLNDGISKDAEFGLELENAKFVFGDYDRYLTASPITAANGSFANGIYTRNTAGKDTEVAYTLTINDDNYAVVKIAETADITDDEAPGKYIKIPLVVRMDESITSGNAKVSLRAGNSGLSSSSLVFATINKGSTTTSVSDVQTGKNRIEIQKLTIKENVAGSMRVNNNGDGFYLELPSGYYFNKQPSVDNITLVNVGVANKQTDLVPELTNGGRILKVKFNNFKPSSNGLIGQITIKGLEIYANSSNELSGSEEVKITIDNLGSSEMVTSQEFLAGTRADYGLSLQTSEAVPTVISGYYDENNLTSDKVKSVKLTVSEATAGSLINDGNLTFTLSESAKLNGVKIEDKENISQSNGTYYLEDEKDLSVEVKANKVTLRSLRTSAAGYSSNDKSKFSIYFYLSV